MLCNEMFHSVEFGQNSVPRARHCLMLAALLVLLAVLAVLPGAHYNK